MRFSNSQTITTRYHSATNQKPSRIIATASGGTRHIRCYDFTGDREEHEAAFLSLLKKLKWDNTQPAYTWCGVCLPKEDGAILWVCVP